MIRDIFFNFIYRFWWVIAFLIFCGILYENGMKRRQSDYEELKASLKRLKIEKKKSLALNQKLKLQVYSQSQHEWEELVLKRVLGLVSEDEKKIVFYQEDKAASYNNSVD